MENRKKESKAYLAFGVIAFLSVCIGLLAGFFFGSGLTILEDGFPSFSDHFTLSLALPYWIGGPALGLAFFGLMKAAGRHGK